MSTTSAYEQLTLVSPTSFFFVTRSAICGRSFRWRAASAGPYVATVESCGNIALTRAILDQHRRRQRAHEIDIRRIMEHLPHRYPMLLVDRIIEFEPGRRIVGLKNVTINEQFFSGHFPEHPIMPGVLVIEAMAQVGGLLLMDAVDDPQDKVVYFMSLNNVKWRRPVTPGDQVVFDVEMQSLRRRICKMLREGAGGWTGWRGGDHDGRGVDK